MDIIRVLRIVEFVGPRDAVEKQVAKSIHGEKTYGDRRGEVTIRAATIGTFPEILSVVEPGSYEAAHALRVGEVA